MQDSPQITPRILVTTDFSLEGEHAFYHALAFAVKNHARLTLLHTGPESRESVPWEHFPGVRETLAVWGLLPPDAPRTAVSETLGIGVTKKAMRDDDPRMGITDYLRRHPTDLLVMATEGRTGLARLLNPSVADTVSHLTKSHTLMLPKKAQGFVDPNSGTSSLRRVLVALDPEKDPRPALAYLKEWLPVMGHDDGFEAVVLRTEAWGGAPRLMMPQAPGQHWRQETCSGDPAEALLSTARELQVGMVAISARGPLGLRDRMRGTRTDQILLQLGLPLLSIPSF